MNKEACEFTKYKIWAEQQTLRRRAAISFIASAASAALAVMVQGNSIPCAVSAATVSGFLAWFVSGICM